MLDEHERRALAELFREDDRLRAENEEYLARREPPAASPVSEDGPGLVDGTMLDAADETGTPSNGDGGFSPEQLETLAEIISEVQKDWDREHATEMAALRCEIEELRTRAFGPQSFARHFAQLTHEVIALREQVCKALDNRGPADIVELPNWRRHGAA